jgi:MraZ protein
VFTGVFHHQLDAKGRTSLPARFRDVLAGQGADKLFVTTDVRDRCLQAYSPEQWEKFTDKVKALPQLLDATRYVMRGMVAPAQECPFDKLGRILLPPTLRAFAGLTTEVVWAGSVERIEIWSPEGWQQCQDKVRTPEGQALLLNEVARLGL